MYYKGSYNNYNSNKNNKPPCRFFQQGSCYKGSKCSFAHVYANNSSNSSNSSSNNNTSKDDKFIKTFEGKTPNEAVQYFTSDNLVGKIESEIVSDINISAKAIKSNPLLSSYSMPNPCTVLLIEPSRELSPEELRWKYYDAKQKNSLTAYENEIKAREADMQKCMEYIKNNSKKAARYLQIGTKNNLQNAQSGNLKPFIDFPIDFNNVSSSTSQPFGQIASPFGQPTNSAFGTPSFGSSQGNSSSGSVFGTPSFSNNTNSNADASNVFGKPAFGATNNANGTGIGSAFGAPTFGSTVTSNNANSNSAGSAFGAPAFGTPAFGATSFGSTAAPNNNNNNSVGSAFGAPAFGSTTVSNNSTAFNSTTTLNAANPFGSIMPALTNNNIDKNTDTFFKSAFGTPTAANGQKQSGIANPFDASAPKPNLFTQNLNSPNSTDTSSPFGTGSFGKPFSNPAGFKANENTTANGSPFAANTSNQQTNPPKNDLPFGNTNNTPNTAVFTTNTNGNQFGQALQSQNHSPFGVNVQDSNSRLANSNTNTIHQRFIQGKLHKEIKEEDLPESVISAFKSEFFVLGEVPDVPPPITLIR
ncbi:uncharacterized protein SCODWIG_00052 [Saccharomycodes ludwigii]|uniref:C3H1-type domain-containing protein n=1 Tax=Saccharomycodes ludwigii TaxID=36035 RepID=A0A376B0Y5_9ASCO|nr:hypothetical protein SCDLUD_001869 [Saccharomycodes ludwigii]KAH3902058.1 hypothetical protein SCDLUD_001869 [Saccharomycodes ludwigii]SSD58291.1 uncharacterized protein SCODWIG_00052 [Saccharomycodes ludwigii]